MFKHIRRNLKDERICVFETVMMMPMMESMDMITSSALKCFNERKREAN